MKPSLNQIPAGKVPAPKSTVPHLHLASMFSRLAQRHIGAAMANAPDPAAAKLPRPDMAAIDTQRGRPLARQAVIGSPNPAANSDF